MFIISRKSLVSIDNGNDRMTGFCCSNRISTANAIQLIGYPLLGSDAVYRACKGSTGIISNLGSQRAICKGQFIINYFGISINNTNCNLCTIFAYQFIGIDCLALPCSCLYLFNNLILQACLTCFTVNGLCHGDIIGIERFDNSVKFAYGNSAHRLFALHFGIIALMYRVIAETFRIPLIIISMVNKRCKQFNLLAGADLYLRMSQVSPEVTLVIIMGSIINLSCSIFRNSLVNRRRGRSVSPHGSVTHHAHCHNCCQHTLCQNVPVSSLFHFQTPFS